MATSVAEDALSASSQNIEERPSAACSTCGDLDRQNWDWDGRYTTTQGLIASSSKCPVCAAILKGLEANLESVDQTASIFMEARSDRSMLVG